MEEEAVHVKGKEQDEEDTWVCTPIPSTCTNSL